MTNKFKKCCNSIKDFFEKHAQNVTGFLEKCVQKVKDSGSGKNSRGAVIIGGGIAILGNYFFSATNPLGTIIFTGVSNLYLSLSTFRELSKKVSADIRRAVGHNSPLASSHWIRWYRTWAPIIPVALFGGLSLVIYGIATYNSDAIAESANATNSTPAQWALALSIVSSILLPISTVLPVVWWSNEVTKKIRAFLRNDDCYIEKIEHSHEPLAVLESFGHGDDFEKLLENTQRFGTDTSDALKKEAKKMVMRAFTVVSDHLAKAIQELDEANQKIKYQENLVIKLKHLQTLNSKLLFLIISIGQLEKTKRLFTERLGNLPAAFKEKLERIDEPEIYDNLLSDLLREHESLLLRETQTPSEKMKDDILNLKLLIENLTKMQRQIKEIENCIEDIKKTQKMGDGIPDNLGKTPAELRALSNSLSDEISTLDDEVNKNRHEISQIQLSELKIEVKKKRAIIERLRRAVAALEEQIVVTDPFKNQLQATLDQHLPAVQSLAPSIVSSHSASISPTAEEGQKEVEVKEVFFNPQGSSAIPTPYSGSEHIGHQRSILPQYHRTRTSEDRREPDAGVGLGLTFTRVV